MSNADINEGYLKGAMNSIIDSVERAESTEFDSTAEKAGYYSGTMNDAKDTAEMVLDELE